MKKFIGALVVLALIAVIIIPRIMDSISDNSSEESGVNLITIGGQKIMKGDLSNDITLIATTSADESYNVMPKITAEVASIEVFVGQYVSEGDVLFEMDKESVEDQVTQAEINLTLAKVALKNARASSSQASISYELAETNYNIQYDNYEFALSNLEKNALLYESGIISETEYEQMKLQSSPEQVEALNKQLEQAKSSITMASIGIESAQAQLQQAQNAYDNVLELLEDATVKSPISGYVTANNLKKGNMAANTQVAMTIESINEINVSANVTEALVPDLRIGQKVKVVVGALDDRVFEGTIEEISTSSNRATLMYPIKINVINKDESIKPGMFATVIVETESVKNALYVPSEAVLLRDGIKYVYIMSGESQVTRVQVTTGIDNGFNTQILDGVTEEDIIVTDGMGLIDENSIVKLIRSDQ